MRAFFAPKQTGRWNIRTKLERRQRAEERARMIERARGTAIKAAPWAAAGTALAAVAWIARPAGRRAIARGTDRMIGKTLGMVHRIRGADVADDVLADRVRASIAPIEKELGVPHVHVAAHDGFVTVEGSVDTRASANAIENAVASVAGIKGVEANLRIRQTRGITIGRLGTVRERTPIS